MKIFLRFLAICTVIGFYGIITGAHAAKDYSDCSVYERSLARCSNAADPTNCCYELFDTTQSQYWNLRQKCVTVCNSGVLPPECYANKTLSVDCDTAQEILDTQCTGIEYEANCNMTYGYDQTLVNDCIAICATLSISGCTSGGGSGGNSCNCTSNSDCGGNTPICDATTHCCRAAQDNEIVQAKDPVCTDGGCVCHLIQEGNDIYSAEYLFTTMQHCGQLQNYTRTNKIWFPQTDCALLDSGMGYYVVEYSNNSSYPICQGYVIQSTERSRSCTECKSGFTRLSFPTVMNMKYQDDYTTSDFYNWPCSGGDSIDRPMYVCVKCVPSYSDWTDYNTGYQSRQVSYNKKCDSSTSSEYRCAPGYYSKTGTAVATTTAELECTRCPMICDMQSNSDAGATSVSECCVDSAIIGTDISGEFELSDDICASQQ